MSDELSISRGPAYRVPRHRGPDPMTRRLLWIATGLSGALVLIVLLWSSASHRSGEVPVVQADQRPVRVKPANPGGMQIPGLGADVTSRDDGSSGTLAPPPEAPDPQALASQAPPPAPAAATPAPQTAPVAAPAAEAPAPANQAASVPQAPPASAAPAPVAERRAARVEPGGRKEVQLAALTTEAAARQEWDRLARRMPALLGPHHPIVTRIEHDGHTLWRLRTGGFITDAEASRFCQQVRAKGGNCAVAAF